jgi:4-amino-4-deoxy-L-arabinose transferase-like glycosyltransferase
MISSGRRATVVVVLGIVAVAFLLHLPGFLRGSIFNPDEAFVATEAQVLDAGGRLYEDVTDRKPPLLPYIYVGAFRVTGSDALWSVRLLAVAAHAGTALLLFSEGRRRAGTRGGIGAAALYLLAAVALKPEDAQAANFEVFMLPAMTAAVVLGARSRTTASGVAVGVATLVKQTAATTLLPLAYLAWRARRSRGLALLAIGAVIPLVIAALVVGPRNFVTWSFTDSGGYLDLEGVSAGFALGAENTHDFLLANGAFLILLPLAWKHRRDDADLWLWLVAAVVGVATGFRFFGHYYLQLLPPLALLAARPLQTARRPLLVTVAVLAVVPAAWLVGEAFDESEFRAEVTAEVASYVKDHTVPGDRIFVWGHLPEIYWQSDRLPASRFVTTGLLTGLSDGRDVSGNQDRAAVGAWDDAFADLDEHPPALIVNASFQDLRSDEFAEKYPRFGEFMEDYELVDFVWRVSIYAPAESADR